MKVPVSWLKDYVDIDISAEELADRLTSVGVPVEMITYMSPDITGVIAAKILKIRPHPDADKLVLADVDTGEDIKQVVTGAPNVREGQIVPLAVHKARLSGGLKIKKSKIRGQVSNGMMCSAKELDLDLKDLPPEEREGVMILPPVTPIGADVTELYCLHDPVLEFETFANRPDQLSVLGIAREVAAALGKEMREPDLNYPEINEKAEDLVKIEIEDFKLCPKYSGRIIRDMVIRKSPLWIQGRLLAAGIRPVNNVVDITNYVMLETGQPLHAFDLDKIKGGKIIVRPAKKGETMKTIDGTLQELDPDMLMITDPSGAVAIAGVMGGLETEVGNETKNILLEAANFNQASVRRTYMRLKLPSESSRRFEKGIDFHRVDIASRRACNMMLKDGGKILAGEAVCSVTPPKPVEMTLRPRRVNHILGTDLDRETIRKLLSGLDFDLKDDGENFHVKVPTVRKDISEEIDLVEEVARLWGYDNIPTTDPIGISLGVVEDKIIFDEKIRDILARSGMQEIITLGLCDERLIREFRLEAEDESILRVINPVTEDQGVVRPDAVPQIIGIVKRNIANRRLQFKLFEISKLYRNIENEEPEERRELIMLMSAPEGSEGDFDFFAMKSVIDFLAKELKIQIDYRKGGYSYLHPGKTAKILANEESLGVVGVLHPEIAMEQEIKQGIVIARLSVDKLYKLSKSPWFKKLPRYPTVERDIAVILDRTTPAGDVEKVILEDGRPLVQEAGCFDVYEGKQVADDKKSLAFRIAFSAPDRTLTDREVQEKIDGILNRLGRELNAELRS